MDLTLCTLCVANIDVLSESTLHLACKIFSASLKGVHDLRQDIRIVLLLDHGQISLGHPEQALFYKASRQIS